MSTASERGRLARQRGVTAERKAAHYLKMAGIPAARRSRGRNHDDLGDIEIPALPGWHVEVKHLKQPDRSGPAGAAQAGGGAASGLGIVPRPGKGSGGLGGVPDIGGRRPPAGPPLMRCRRLLKRAKLNRRCVGLEVVEELAQLWYPSCKEVRPTGGGSGSRGVILQERWAETAGHLDSAVSRHGWPRIPCCLSPGANRWGSASTGPTCAATQQVVCGFSMQCAFSVAAGGSRRLPHPRNVPGRTEVAHYSPVSRSLTGHHRSGLRQEGMRAANAAGSLVVPGYAVSLVDNP